MKPVTRWFYKILLFFLIWGYFIGHPVILPPSVAFYHFVFPFLFLLNRSPVWRFRFQSDTPTTLWCRLLSYSTVHPYATHSSWQPPACVVWSDLVDSIYYDPCYLLAHWCVSLGLTSYSLCHKANMSEVIRHRLGAGGPWLTTFNWCARLLGHYQSLPSPTNHYHCRRPNQTHQA